MYNNISNDAGLEKQTAMQVLNSTTGQVEELSITDRKSGCEWTADLVGNSGVVKWDDDRDIREMNAEDIAWWQNIIDGLNKIEDLKDECRDFMDSEDFEALEIELSENGNANDWDMHISVLVPILEAYIKANEE